MARLLSAVGSLKQSSARANVKMMKVAWVRWGDWAQQDGYQLNVNNVVVFLSSTQMPSSWSLVEQPVLL